MPGAKRGRHSCQSGGSRPAITRSNYGGPLGVGVSVAFPQLPPGLVGLGALGDLGAPGGIHLLGISKGWWGQCNKPRAIAAYCGPTGEPCER